MTATVPARAEPRGGVLAPLLRPGVYRIVWTANLVSSLGTLIQGVGAAWLMTSLAGTPDMVALVQTATQAPRRSSRSSPVPSPTSWTAAAC